MQLVRTTAHIGIVLLNKIPADLVLRDRILLLIRRDIGWSGRLRWLKIRGIVGDSMDMVVRIMIGVGYRIIAVNGGLSIGHCVIEESVEGWVRDKSRDDLGCREKVEVEVYEQ